MLVEKPLSLLSGEFNNQTLTKFFKVRTDGSHFLFKEKYRLTTAKAIEVKILQCNMCLSMIVFEYTEKLKCCVADWSVERGFSKRERREIRPNSSSLTPNQLAPNVSKILATGNYSLTPQSEWVKVEDLRLRDQVLRSDGSWGTVTGIYYYNTEPTKVYNLEVEDNHTYVVGGDVLGIGYVVHNYIVDQKDKFLSGAEVEKAYKDHKKMGEKAEIKWGDKTYKKVNGEGEGVAVFVRDYDDKGTKEYIRITKDGLIEQKIKWKGQLGEFMANTLSGEKTKYFNTRGEEVFLQPDKLVRDGGSKKLPFDPVDTKLANNIVDKVKNDYEQSLRTEYANDKKSKLTPAQIDVKVKAEMAVYNRIADRTFKNSYTDENGNAIKHGSDKFLEKLQNRNLTDRTVRRNRMEWKFQ